MKLKNYLLALALILAPIASFGEGGNVRGTPTGGVKRDTTGVTGSIPKYETNGQLGPSIMSDAGTFITVNGPVSSSNTLSGLSNGSLATLNRAGSSGFTIETFGGENGDFGALAFWAHNGVRNSSTAVLAGQSIGGMFFKGFDGVNNLNTTPSKAQINIVADKDFAVGNTPMNINFVTQKPNNTGSTNRRVWAAATSTGPWVFGNLGTSNVTGVLDAGATAQVQVTPQAGILNAIYSNGNLKVVGVIDLDRGTGVGQATLDGSTGGCVMLRDTDDAGWTECDALDGTLSCSVDADGVCD